VGNDVKIFMEAQAMGTRMDREKRAHRNTVEQIVLCPGCEREFCKALYDWQFIYCDNCQTYFEKHTGKRIECDRPPKRYWVRDSDTQDSTIDG